MDVEVALPIDAAQCADESSRCLSCGCVRYDDCDLRLLCEEYGIDMDRFRGKTARERVDESHELMVYDANKCILCGKCVRVCTMNPGRNPRWVRGPGLRHQGQPSMDLPLGRDQVHRLQGNCADACPTAAVSFKVSMGRRPGLPSPHGQGRGLLRDSAPSGVP
jgi:formate dehydrogenase major subunit